MDMGLSLTYQDAQSAVAVGGTTTVDVIVGVTVVVLVTTTVMGLSPKLESVRVDPSAPGGSVG